MNRIFFVLLGSSLLVLPGLAIAQAHSDLLTELTRSHEYTLKRVSSYDRTGETTTIGRLPPERLSRYWMKRGPPKFRMSGSRSRVTRDST